MSYRGLDFSQGLGKYQDLIRAAYQDRMAQQHQQLQDNFNAQQAATLYGYDGPGVNPVVNPFYTGGDPTQTPTVSNTPVPDYTTQIPGQGAPQAPQGPQDAYSGFTGNRTPFGGRDPSQNAGFIFPTPGDKALYEKAQAQLSAKLDAATPPQKPGDPTPAAPLSPVDQMIRRYANQENIHPFVLRQLIDLKEKEMAQKRGSSDMVEIVKAIAGSRPTYVGPKGNTPVHNNPQEVSILNTIKDLYLSKTKVDSLLGDPFKSRELSKVYGGLQGPALKAAVIAGIDSQISGLQSQLQGVQGGAAPKAANPQTMIDYGMKNPDMIKKFPNEAARRIEVERRLRASGKIK